MFADAGTLVDKDSQDASLVLETYKHRPLLGKS